MAKQRKIQDYDPLYSFLRHYVDAMLKLSYRTIRYVGRERVPQDGAVIYAPNHTNALMDALVILAMDRKAKVFVARADIFRNKTLAKVFAFLKIMPIMRIRDGFDEVKKNHETIERAVDVLRDKVPFCIFPEGQHQAKYSSLPLSKGIFRIAFQAQELMPDMPLYIVPVGMRYGSFFRFRSTVRVEVGDPIDVRRFMAEHTDLTPQEQMNIMREELAVRMRDSIFHIPNDADYEAIYELCAAVVKQQAKSLEAESPKRLHRLDAHFRANKLTVEQLAAMRTEDPERAERLLQLGREAAAMRAERKINLNSVSVRYPILSRILKTLFVVGTCVYWLPVSILVLPMTALCAFLFTKLKDPAFRNSVRYMVNLLLWPLLVLIYAVIALVVLPWPWALGLILALIPAPIVAQDTWRLLRLAVSDFRLFAAKDLRQKYNEIRTTFFNR
ncbi:MAG: 1-acyl-sn-glycerol-3-phosphate acyltransferase [Alistipes sp.]|nr:1-acyl-sn-glycerol-3-phosphate acyltransferase [Alistipes sp.]